MKKETLINLLQNTGLGRNTFFDDRNFYIKELLQLTKEQEEIILSETDFDKMQDMIMIVATLKGKVNTDIIQLFLEVYKKNNLKYIDLTKNLDNLDNLDTLDNILELISDHPNKAETILSLLNRLKSAETIGNYLCSIAHINLPNEKKELLIDHLPLLEYAINNNSDFFLEKLCYFPEDHIQKILNHMKKVSRVFNNQQRTVEYANKLLDFISDYPNKAETILSLLNRLKSAEAIENYLSNIAAVHLPNKQKELLIDHLPFLEYMINDTFNSWVPFLEKLYYCPENHVKKVLRHMKKLSCVFNNQEKLLEYADKLIECDFSFDTMKEMEKLLSFTSQIKNENIRAYLLSYDYDKLIGLRLNEWGTFSQIQTNFKQLYSKYDEAWLLQFLEILDDIAKRKYKNSDLIEYLKDQIFQLDSSIVEELFLALGLDKSLIDKIINLQKQGLNEQIIIVLDTSKLLLTTSRILLDDREKQIVNLLGKEFLTEQLVNANHPDALKNMINFTNELLENLTHSIDALDEKTKKQLQVPIKCYYQLNANANLENEKTKRDLATIKDDILAIIKSFLEDNQAVTLNSLVEELYDNAVAGAPNSGLDQFIDALEEIPNDVELNLSYQIKKSR